MTLIVVGYFLVCFYCEQATQLECARWLTMIFAMVMCWTIVGIAEGTTNHANPTLTTTTTAPQITAAPNATTTMSPQFDGLQFYDATVGMLKDTTTSLFNNVSSTTTPPLSGYENCQARKIPFYISFMWDEGCISLTSVYLYGLIVCFLIAGILHLPEMFILVHGIWYLLCLPGGYLFLMIYSFCNLNDVKWGTREEKEKKNGSEIGYFEQFMKGMGRAQKHDKNGETVDEPFFSFVGRLLCCRRIALTNENIFPLEKVAGEKEKEVPKTRTTDWSLVWDGRKTHFTAVSQSLNSLRDELNKLKATRDYCTPQSRIAITNMMIDACLSCPALKVEAYEFGRCKWNTVDGDQGNFSCGSCGSCERECQCLVPEHIDFLLKAITVVLDNKKVEPTPFSAPTREDDVFKTVQKFLAENCGFQQDTCDEVSKIFIEHGYDDESFLFGLKVDDLKVMKFEKLNEGPAIISRFMYHLSNTKQLRNIIPSTIPDQLKIWLSYLHLEIYESNFAFLGFRTVRPHCEDQINSDHGKEDVIILENLTSDDVKNMGITKRAHVNKLNQAIKEIKKLAHKGQKPESLRADSELSKGDKTRTFVNDIEDSDFEKSFTRDKLDRDQGGDLDLLKNGGGFVFKDELNFWTNLVEIHLDKNLDRIENEATLKDDLLKLRGQASIALFIMNMIWLCLMSAFQSTDSLDIFFTTPLGVAFLMVFGFLFGLQFLSMCWHRLGCLVEALTVMTPEKAEEKNPCLYVPRNDHVNSQQQDREEDDEMLSLL